MTDIVERLRERATSIARATLGREERFQSKTAALCLEAANTIDLLLDDIDKFNEICDRNEDEIERLRKLLEGK